MSCTEPACHAPRAVRTVPGRIDTVSDGRRSVPESPEGGAFGPNAWLVDDMYEQYRADPSSVSESWQEFFADYAPSPPSAGAATSTATEILSPPPAQGTPPPQPTTSSAVE